MDCCLDHLVLPTEAVLHRQAEVRGLLLRPHDNKGHLVLDTKHHYILPTPSLTPFFPSNSITGPPHQKSHIGRTYIHTYRQTK